MMSALVKNIGQGFPQIVTADSLELLRRHGLGIRELVEENLAKLNFSGGFVSMCAIAAKYDTNIMESHAGVYEEIMRQMGLLLGEIKYVQTPTPNGHATLKQNVLLLLPEWKRGTALKNVTIIPNGFSADHGHWFQIRTDPPPYHRDSEYTRITAQNVSPLLPREVVLHHAVDTFFR